MDNRLFLDSLLRAQVTSMRGFYKNSNNFLSVPLNAPKTYSVIIFINLKRMIICQQRQQELLRWGQSYRLFHILNISQDPLQFFHAKRFYGFRGTSKSVLLGPRVYSCKLNQHVGQRYPTLLVANWPCLNTSYNMSNDVDLSLNFLASFEQAGPSFLYFLFIY